MPTHQIDPFLKGKKVVYVPEVNYTGQFAQLLKTEYHDVEFTRINIYGGQPFNVEHILDAVKPVVLSGPAPTPTTETEAAIHA